MKESLLSEITLSPVLEGPGERASVWEKGEAIQGSFMKQMKVIFANTIKNVSFSHCRNGIIQYKKYTIKQDHLN